MTDFVLKRRDTAEIETRIAKLVLDLDAARALARRLAKALAVCDGHRGAFSCSDQHDLRCLKARGEPEAECECGRDELDAAVAAFDAVQATWPT